MKYWWPAMLFFVVLGSEALAVQKEEGIVKFLSHHSVNETVDKLKTILQSKGVTLFALVDHSGEAEKVGMKMPPTKLLIFGQSEGRHATDAGCSECGHRPATKDSGCEDSQGQVWISYNSPEYLKERPGLSSDLLPNIAIVETVAKAAGE